MLFRELVREWFGKMRKLRLKLVLKLVLILVLILLQKLRAKLWEICELG